MKTACIALSVLALSIVPAVAGDAYSTTVPVSQSICIVPPRTEGGRTWATNTTYRHGDLVVANSRGYMIVSTGTVTTGVSNSYAPSHVRGDAAVGTPSITYRRTWAVPRGLADICVVSGGPVWTVPDDVTPADGIGAYMQGPGSTDVYVGNGAIWARASTQAVVSVRELDKARFEEVP